MKIADGISLCFKRAKVTHLVGVTSSDDSLIVFGYKLLDDMARFLFLSIVKRLDWNPQLVEIGN